MMAHFTTLVLLCAPVMAAAQPHAGRIEVRSVRGAFNLGEARVNLGARSSAAGGPAQGKPRTEAAVQDRVAAGWSETWIEVVPEADGKLQISLQSDASVQQANDDTRRVWVDDIRVRGATVVNGDLEQLNAEGLPQGWSWSRRPPPHTVSRDGSIAASGKVCVAVWRDCQPQQVLDVRGGQPVWVSARFRMVPTAEELTETARHRAQFDAMMETRPQTVTVQLASAEAAGRAVLRPLPLYNGAAWAVTQRRDDNNAAHLKMRQVLLAHGYRGTFFLNDPAIGFNGNDYGLLEGRPRSEVGRTLLGDGFTLGAHSLTHPMLAFLNRNRMFEELLGCRIAIEAAFDALVNSYAFSFGNVFSDLDGVRGHRDITLMLARAGFIQAPELRLTDNGSWPLGWASILPPDGAPIDNPFASLLANKSLQASDPCISFGEHTWFRTPEAWAAFEAQLDKYGRRPEWWYCNQNEYGAYRAQYARASRAQPTREAANVSLVFERPVLTDLNDPIPLTFEVSGVRSEEIVGITAGDARVERVTAGPDVARFQLHHATSEQLPKRIDHLACEQQEPVKSAKFPGVEGELSFDGSEVRLEVHNTSASPLRQLRIVYRLPLVAESGVVRRERFDLAPGQIYRDVLPLGSTCTDARYRIGSYFVAAQLDFRQEEAAGRIHLSAHAPGSWDDASYPNHGFLVLGPIPRQQIDLAAVAPAEVHKSGWPLADGRKLALAAIAPAITDKLGAEIIGVRGVWSNNNLKPCVYLLSSTVNSPQPREIQFVRNPKWVPAIWLDGRRVEGTVTLKAGASQLLFAYEPDVNHQFAPDHAGPALRIVDAQTGKRLDDIKYQR